MKIKDLNLDKLNSKDPKVKYGYAKELLKIAADTTELLYQHFDHWTQMMASDNNILRWTAIDIIGHLSAVDSDNKIKTILTDLVTLLQGGHLITCNHAIFALGLIASNKPKKREEIIEELLLVSKDEFDNQDCKDIATG